MIHEIIQFNFSPVVLCVLFAAYVLIDRCFEDKIRYLFLSAVGIILIVLLIDDIEWIEKERAYATTLRYIETSAGYILRPLIAIIVTAIFVESNKRNIGRVGKILFLIPLVINTVIVISNTWTDWVYTYNDQNQFVRGPLGYITFVVGFFYMGYMVSISIMYFKQRKKGEVAVIIMMALLCVVGTMLESLYLFTGFLAGVSIIGTVLYYLYLHVSIYSFDSLTGAYNRRIFDLDIKKINEPVIIVSMDLNHLKEVNDSQGHHKGDEFIIAFSREVIRHKAKRTQFYRIGGDEFILVVKNLSEEQVYKRIELIEENLNKKGYSFAYGLSTFHPTDDIDQFIRVIDQKMYQKKMEMKQL